MSDGNNYPCDKKDDDNHNLQSEFVFLMAHIKVSPEIYIFLVYSERKCWYCRCSAAVAAQSQFSRYRNCHLITT